MAGAGLNLDVQRTELVSASFSVGVLLVHKQEDCLETFRLLLVQRCVSLELQMYMY